METVEGLVVRESMSPAPAFSGEQMIEALAAYRKLQTALDKSMPDQLMQLDSKTFRKKGYWRAISVAFNLTVRPIDERREVNSHFDDGRDNFGYIVTYEASAANGRSATGDGSCFAIEKARRFRCPHPEREGSTRTLHYPAENCPSFDPAYQWKTLPAQSTEHNIRSHAHTRAFNRAVSNLVGFGEVSAEEVDRDEHGTTDGATKTSTASSSTTTVTPPAANADGSSKVKDVTAMTPKDGDKKAKPGWVIFENDKKYSTFDEAVLKHATEAKEHGWLMVPKLEVKGKYTNIVGVERVVQKEPELPLKDDEPVGTPEKVLFTQDMPETSVKGNDGETQKIAAYTKFQTDCRLYVTRNADFIKIAKGAKEGKMRVKVEFEAKPAANGNSLVNHVKDLQMTEVPA